MAENPKVMEFSPGGESGWHPSCFSDVLQTLRDTEAFPYDFASISQRVLNFLFAFEQRHGGGALSKGGRMKRVMDPIRFYIAVVVAEQKALSWIFKVMMLLSLAARSASAAPQVEVQWELEEAAPVIQSLN